MSNAVQGLYAKVCTALLVGILAGTASRGLAQCEPRGFNAYEEAMVEVYIAYYGRPPDLGGLAYWADRLEREGGSLESIINAFGDSAEYDERFGQMDEEQLVTNLYFQMFGRDPDPGGLGYYIDKLRGGSSTLARIALDILYGALNDDQTVLHNRALVAQDFVTRLETRQEQYQRGYVDAGLLLCQVQTDPAGRDAACAAGERIAAGPDAADVAYRIPGLNAGPYVCSERDYQTGEVASQDPASGRDMRMREGQMDALLARIAPHTEWVRTFGCTQGLSDLARRAKARGLKVALGAWIGRDPATNQDEIDCAIDAARQGWADMLIVGSEVLLRDDVPLGDLLGLIETVKAQTSLPVTHGALYGNYLDQPALIDAVDLVLANFYPYWEGVSIDDAVCDLADKYGMLAATAGDREVWVGETGWPSAGESIGGAVPSADHAARYFSELASWAGAAQVPYLYFEALDEPWKVRAEGERGAHWGVWDKYGAMKPGMIEVFAGTSVPIDCAPAEPTVSLVYVPPVGSFENLTGSVRNLDPADGAVGVYIRVAGGWWTKPTFASPITTIGTDSNWVCDITTGGRDETATDIAAFLVPQGYSLPALSGPATLPEELRDTALDWVEVSRVP